MGTLPFSDDHQTPTNLGIALQLVEHHNNISYFRFPSQTTTIQNTIASPSLQQLLRTPREQESHHSSNTSPSTKHLASCYHSFLQERDVLYILYSTYLYLVYYLLTATQLSRGAVICCQTAHSIVFHLHTFREASTLLIFFGGLVVAVFIYPAK